MSDTWPIGGSLKEMSERARLLIAFADGQEEAGFVMTARRMRTVARDTLELAKRVHGYERVMALARTETAAGGHPIGPNEHGIPPEAIVYPDVSDAQPAVTSEP